MNETDIVMRSQREDDVIKVDTIGSDLTVFKAARLSRRGDAEQPDEDRMVSFIMRLIKDCHYVPFEHCVITFMMQAPIFVFRQLFRYRTAAISEMSMRYCEAAPEFYLPDYLKDESATELMRLSYQNSWNTYNDLLAKGVKKEMARAVLPTALFSRCLFTINLRNLFHLLDQRISPHAQRETEFVATRMYELARSSFPMSVMAWYADRCESRK